MSKIRTRFAPSPTGNLHVGSLRTALYAWAYAKHYGGDFILRIEDTDTERNSVDSTKGILDGLTWAGITWDEGPFYQTDRLQRYIDVVNDLIKKGLAFYCLDDKKDYDQKSGLYRSSYRNLNITKPNTSYVVRLKVPDDVKINYTDIVKGEVNTSSSLIEDWVILRSNGIPTYNFAVVIDDIDMDITHVIRGDDHVSNTPKQCLLYNMLNKQQPVFGHIPMILDSNGKKLSKRNLDKIVATQSFPVDIDTAKNQGLCPQALLNYLARLGWAKDQNEIFDMNSFVSWFDGTGIQSSAARVDHKKLHWLNVQHLKMMSNDDVVKWSLLQTNVVDSTLYRHSILNVLDDLRLRGDKTTTFSSDFVFLSKFLNSLDLLKQSLNDDDKTTLCWSSWKLPLFSWTVNDIENSIKEAAALNNFTFGEFATSVRKMLSSEKVTPPIGIILKTLGPELSVSWLSKIKNNIDPQRCVVSNSDCDI